MSKFALALAASMCAATALGAGPEPMKAEIKVKDGAPCMLLNGAPTPLIIYRDHRPWEHTRAVKSFASSGITLLTVASTPVARDREQIYKGLEKLIVDTLVASPDAKFMVIINTAVNKRSHQAWMAQSPDETAQWPGFKNPAGDSDELIEGDRVSMASKLWLETAAKDIHALVERVRSSPYASRVFGYFLTGTSGEWTDWYDYSKPAQAGFKAWLKDKYKDDKTLQSAWNDKAVTLEQAAIPKWSSFFKGDCGNFFDSAKSRRQLDFLDYHHSLPATVIGRLAKEIKDASGNESLVGLFYGYIASIEWGNETKPYTTAQFRMRHKAMAKLLDSPYIDIFGSPYSYQERHAGGTFVQQMPTDSIIMHGKMALTEDDTRTHLATPHKAYGAVEKNGDNFGQAANEAEAVSLLKRNFAGVFSKPGSGFWYFGLGDDGNAWWESPKIYETAATLSKIAKDKLEGQDANASEIAVIASFRAEQFQSFNRLPNEFISKQLGENMTRIGAPYDLHLDTDLFKPEFPFGKYKMFVFLNTFHFTDAERAVIKEKVQTGGKTAVWIYAPGFVTDKALSADAVSELTGIKLEMRPLALPGLHCVVTDYDSPFTKGLPTNFRFGTDSPYRKLGPVFHSVDAGATRLGDMLATTDADGVLTFRKAGLCAKKLPNWTSVWCAIPNMPSPLLRNIARNAGVNIYDDQDDQVLASRKLLAIHSGHNGERVVKLPRKCKVTDPFTGKTVSQGASEFKVSIDRGDTFLALMED